MKLCDTAGPSEKILKNKIKFFELFTIKYDIMDYGVMIDLWRKSFIEPVKSFLH